MRAAKNKTFFSCFLLLAPILLNVIITVKASSELTVFSGGFPMANTTRLEPVSPGDNIIKLAVVGDIMMGRKVAEVIQANNNDPTFPFRYIKKHLAGFDIKIANLEAQITDSDVIKKPIVPCNETTGLCCDLLCHFKTNKSVVDGLSYAGFNLVLLENNHIEDYEGGREDTIEALNSYQMPWIDAEHPLEMFNYKGCNLSFFNYDAVRKVHTTAKIKSQLIADLKNAEANSFKVVLIHAGKEYGYNETLKQKELAHAAVDYGANIVIFSHAHVVLGHEIYKEKLIFWGLGDFVFDLFFNDRVTQFLMVKFDIINCNTVENVQKVSGVINNSSQPIVSRSEPL